MENLDFFSYSPKMLLEAKHLTAGSVLLRKEKEKGEATRWINWMMLS